MNFPQPAIVKRPFTIQTTAWVAASLVLISVLCQLFTYEDMPQILAELFGLSQAASAIAAALLVTVEVFSLPYLFAMSVSPAMYRMSGVFAGATSLLWFFTALTSAHSENIALLGSVIALPGGIGAFLIAGVLLVSTSRTILWSLKKLPLVP